ncbi:UNVERIFIED_CONTAM: hypothetical protein PYX00_000497 [Menopon gallinae]|uniref:Peroxidase n=1 Tax=Menopon gallinae TaxID=328185 RepID=A0AAW2I9F2_9NEOP
MIITLIRDGSQETLSRVSISERNAENDEIFPRIHKQTDGRSLLEKPKFASKSGSSRNMHFIKVFGDQLGLNGKFITNHQDPIKPILKISEVESEFGLSRNVNKTVSEENEDSVKGQKNEVDNFETNIDKKDEEQHLLPTMTTELYDESSDFKAKDESRPATNYSSQQIIPVTKTSSKKKDQQPDGKPDEVLEYRQHYTYSQAENKAEEYELKHENDAIRTDFSIDEDVNVDEAFDWNSFNLSAEARLKEQKELLTQVTDYGLQQLHQILDVKEREIFQAGIFLEKNSPGGYLAAFNSQSKELKKLARFGYAALQASHKLRDELLASKMRQEILNITDDNTRKFPQISLIDTSLHEDCPLKNQPRCPSWNHLFRTIDGTCNNLKHPWWGAVFQPLKRFLAPAYSDGLESVRLNVRGLPLPSPRKISTTVLWDKNVPSTSVTHLLMQWGQFIDHDITAASQSRGFNGSIPRCCDVPPNLLHPDCLPIEVPANDPFYGRFGIRCLEFLRSAPTSRVGCLLGPREQINQVTSYIDGSMIYGSTNRESQKLRLFRNGMMRYTRMPQRLPLLPSDRTRNDFCRDVNQDFGCFMGGDLRMNEQPGLLAMHTVFLRLHNRLTRQLAHLNPHWSDERLYQETRRIVGAIIQHITYREFLPVVLGQDVIDIFGLRLLKDGYFMQYDDRVSATASNSFAAAAFRFGHSMVQGRYLKWDELQKQAFGNITLREELFDPGRIHRFGAVDELILGMCFQEAQRRDEHLTEELTNHLFETPSFPAGLDLASINIQRGRDHGLPSYNAWRNPCGLRRAVTWDDLLHVMAEESRNNLRRVYRDVDDIDLYVGGLAEHPVRGGIVGSTFSCIIAQHFRNLRKSDRFWYENGGFDSSFSVNQLRAIRRITLARILCDNLDLIDSVQPFAFLTVDRIRNPRVSCRSSSIPFIDLSHWKEQSTEKWNQKGDAPSATSDGAGLADMPLPKADPSSVSEFPKPMKEELET